MKLKMVMGLLALALTAGMTACGSSGDVASSHESQESSEESDKEEDTSDESAESEDASASDETENTEESEETEAVTEEDAPAAQDADISFDGLTVVDNDNCTIEITDIKPDSTWGYELGLLLENKTADTNYMFACEEGAVNGVQFAPVFASEVAPGKKDNTNVTISGSPLEAADLSDFTDIELSFRVYDSENWEIDDVANETVHVYPYGEEVAAIYEREPQSTDNVLVDNENVSFIITGYELDDIWGYTVNLYLKNKTEQDLMFAIQDASVNGYMLDPYFATSLLPGKCTFASMSWSEDTLEENDIAEVTSIEFTLRVYDMNNWSDDDIVNETFTVNP